MSDAPPSPHQLVDQLDGWAPSVGPELAALLGSAAAEIRHLHGSVQSLERHVARQHRRELDLRRRAERWLRERNDLRHLIRTGRTRG